jgi:short-subunit dehydrogenase
VPLSGPTATGFADRAHAKDTLLFKRHVADAASVALAGYRGMMRGRDLVIPGISNNLVPLAARLSPRRLLLWISRKTVE